MARSFLIASGITTLLLSAVSIAILIVLAYNLSGQHVRFYTVAVSAAIVHSVNILSLFALFLTAIDGSLRQRSTDLRRSNRRTIVYILVAFAMAAASLSLSLTTFACIQTKPAGVETTSLGKNIWEFVYAGYIFCSLNLVAEASFLVILAMQHSRREDAEQILDSSPKPEQVDAADEEKRIENRISKPASRSQKARLPSGSVEPVVVAKVSSAPRSLRANGSYGTKQPLHVSIPNANLFDGSLKKTPRAPHKAASAETEPPPRQLSPIPQSRPGSANGTAHGRLQGSPPRQQKPSPSREMKKDSAVEVVQAQPSRLRSLRSASHPSLGSSSSPSDESHIHPLFRSHSNLPPPAHTPSTTVVASALGGSHMPAGSLTRTRSCSGLNSPTNLSRPPSALSNRRSLRSSRSRASSRRTSLTESTTGSLVARNHSTAEPLQAHSLYRHSSVPGAMSLPLLPCSFTAASPLFEPAQVVSKRRSDLGLRVGGSSAFAAHASVQRSPLNAAPTIAARPGRGQFPL